ncbi:hypothetical protein SNEBB_005639 [Seison nebaliae]|nr:hypothetical protein SNEBB_005639 [Seison nebaliae]
MQEHKRSIDYTSNCFQFASIVNREIRLRYRTDMLTSYKGKRSIIKQLNNMPLTDCKQYCASSPQCSNVEFNLNTRQCRFYKSVRSSEIAYRPNNNIYVKRKCRNAFPMRKRTCKYIRDIDTRSKHRSYVDKTLNGINLPLSTCQLVCNNERNCRGITFHEKNNGYVKCELLNNVADAALTKLKNYNTYKKAACQLIEKRDSPQEIDSPFGGRCCKSCCKACPTCKPFNCEKVSCDDCITTLCPPCMPPKCPPKFKERCYPCTKTFKMKCKEPKCDPIPQAICSPCEPEVCKCPKKCKVSYVVQKLLCPAPSCKILTKEEGCKPPLCPECVGCSKTECEYICRDIPKCLAFQYSTSPTKCKFLGGKNLKYVPCRKPSVMYTKKQDCGEVESCDCEEYTDYK